MRGALPLLSRAPASDPSRLRSPSPQPTATPPQPVPTIRLISATPSAHGSAADASLSFASSYVNVPAVSSPLVPRHDENTAPAASTRRRLVPKKSKLGLLGGSSKAAKPKAEERGKDMSDVVRRVGGSASAGRGGFEIYVDPAEDPEIGDILMVKKKKSRVGLNGMKWGTLGEVTNVPSSAPNGKKDKEGLLKVKTDENQKWWSIGRGRKDSKEKKEKEKKEKERQRSASRAKSPEPSRSEQMATDSRARFNSLDSGIVLASPAAFGPMPVPPAPDAPKSMSRSATLQIPSAQVQTLRVEPMRRSTDPIFVEEEPSPTFLAPPANNGTGSIAVRAMRSMRSMARIGSWAQLKQGEKEPMPVLPAGTNAGIVKKKEKEKGEQKKKEKRKKEKEAEGREQTVRGFSGSSFEAGGLTSPEFATFKENDAEGGANKKKQGMLGIGLPSTMRFGSARAVSSASSNSNGSTNFFATLGKPSVINRLSNGSSTNLDPNTRARSGSEVSSLGSLRPLSTSSGMSGQSSSSSAGSVKWDEEGLETVKETRRREREEREEENRRAGRNETRKASDGRRRAALADIFPETMAGSRRASQASSADSSSSVPMPMPIVTIEEATADGHDDAGMDSPYETPNKRRRARPVSEQVMGKERPKAICDDVDGVLSILDAATNDLASLINRLDLEATPGATPGTPDMSPFRLPQRVTDMLAESPKELVSRASMGSPIKRSATTAGSPSKHVGVRGSMASVTSLRPYAQSRGTATASDPKAPATWSKLGQQIAPWPISPTKPSPQRSGTMPRSQPSVPVFRLTHKRTFSPAPMDEGPLVFRPLKPAKPKTQAGALAASVSPMKGNETPPTSGMYDAAPTSVTFGSKPKKMSGLMSLDDMQEPPSPTPVFRKASVRRPRLSVDTKASVISLPSQSPVVSMSPEARKGLGLAGTLGESDEMDNQQIESDDPDSDIPDELQVILSGQSDGDTGRFDDTLSFQPAPSMRPLPSPGLPPEMPLPTPDVSNANVEAPVFHAQLIDDDENHADIDGTESEDDTKKSFDFTGELKKLNESGAGDRRSFVDQLESAFRTPAKFDLDGFGEFSKDEIPPVPVFLKDQSESSVSQIVPESVGASSNESDSYDSYDAPPPSLLPSPELSGESVSRRTKSSTRSKLSGRSKPSDGQLNVNFKFGGKASTSPPESEQKPKPMTLSDIIPPPERARAISMSSLAEDERARAMSMLSLVEEDSSLLKSIYAKASEIPVSSPRRRVNSDTSVKRHSRVQMLRDESTSSHSRGSSGASFSGFESFGEVRRGFEFPADRPAFYPPVNTGSRRGHNKEQSVFSIASVSSYGAVLNPGTADPFQYGEFALQSRPSSDDMSWSMSMSVDDTFSFMHRDSRRQRVDSDASSFYFRAPGSNQILQPLKRGHRHQDSAMSTTSVAPPVSLYNRSFGAHRRNDSSSSASSVAIAYARYGARASWARHRQDPSMDSVYSDMSALRVSRPGLGDKMLDSALDYGMPLTSISASPPESVIGERIGNKTSFDSIIDDDQRSVAEDSLFEKTGHRTSVSSESVFGDNDYSQYRQFRVPQFRPISIISVDDHRPPPSPKREDDTMITMLDGGHVRRRSVGSLFDGSPCAQAGKRKHGAIRGPQHRVAGSDGEIMESPNKARIIEKPSIASSSYSRFGGDNMIKARKGLLERQSLEDSCLVAEGEDHSYRPMPVFTRPAPANRSRSSTYSSATSGSETPPLSSSDGSSMSSDSQSSIDLSHVNAVLANMTHPMNPDMRNRVRTRARGHGHRRRASAARASRTSVYETIEEEMSVENSPVPMRFFPSAEKKILSPVPDHVTIVSSDESECMEIDDERDISALRKYYALKDEAHVTVEESKRMWMDTPFSIYAVQSFFPPDHPSGMQALLEHSQQAYGPLASELRPRRMRSRTQSRPSPYPRSSKVSVSPSAPLSNEHLPLAPKEVVYHPSPLQQRPFNPNIRAGDVSPFVPDKSGKNSFELPARPRVPSNARRNALGWSKRSTGRDNKENKQNTSNGSIATPGETLRMNRPRPRGRPTPARPLSVRI